MSPNVSSFVSDLVEMAKATEQVPHLQARVHDLEDISRRDGDTIARLELRVMDLQNQLDSEKALRRSVEAERDDAGFRLLEAEDRVAAFIRLAKDITAAVDSTLTAQEPQSEPEPVPTQPEAIVAPTTSASEPVTASTGDVVPDVSASTSQSESPAPEVALASDPTSAQPAPTTGGTPPTADTSASEPVEAQTSLPSASPGPYFGKRYYQHPGYVSRHDWLTGGGTDESYDWKPWAATA